MKPTIAQFGYPPTLQGLAQFLAHKYSGVPMTEQLFHEALESIFHDFIGPVVMDHGENFRITNFGTFRRYITLERPHVITQKLMPTKYTLKFTGSRNGGYK